MSISWNATGDFASVVDTVEPITLARRGTHNEVAIAAAWRFQQQEEESAASGGSVIKSDLTWQFEWSSSEPDPAAGDRLIDANNDCWTVLSVKRRGGGTRWQCTSRNLRIAYGLHTELAVEQAIWEDLGSGLEITGWDSYWPAIHARIQPEQVVVDETTTPISSSLLFQIYLEETIPLDHNHRFVDGEGNAYRLLTYEQTDRIDVLPVAHVRLETV